MRNEVNSLRTHRIDGCLELRQADGGEERELELAHHTVEGQKGDWIEKDRQTTERKVTRARACLTVCVCFQDKEDGHLEPGETETLGFVFNPLEPKMYTFSMGVSDLGPRIPSHFKFVCLFIRRQLLAVASKSDPALAPFLVVSLRVLLPESNFEA